MIDVIVPVYRGLDETRACLESVWQSQNLQPMRLIVINDCSPEPELTAWLREKVATQSMELLENEENLGFVATVNRGMALSDRNDVVLLNSDTEVHSDWLDRLCRAASSDPTVGTVTPFSNNATICSYPGFCQDNELPHGYSLGELDSLFARVNPERYFDIPTAVGFCMYIRREVLNKVGLFDVEKFGKGYGEENDFCCRAISAGYRNILAGDVFVWHKGNVSFGDSHNDRKQQAQQVIDRLHPTYALNVQKHILADPAREARLSVDIERWRTSNCNRLLFITHDRGGGTEQHCRELARLLVDQALVFRLSPAPVGLICLSVYADGEPATFYFQIPKDYLRLIELLKTLAIDHVHFHHLLGHDPVLFELANDLGVTYDVTLHDYYFYCPQITVTTSEDRYCGEEGIEQCRRCLKERPVGIYTIEGWREEFAGLLQGASLVITPTSSVASRFEKTFGLTNIVIAEHPDALQGWARTVRFSYSPQRPLRVAALGALSQVKGADLIEAAANDADMRHLPIQFKLFGYAYRSLQASSKLEIHGPYALDELETLLKEWEPDLVWLPAQLPETYSYTLSHCFALGLPVLVSNLGALLDRIEGRPFSWSHPWQSDASSWNDRMLEIARTTPNATVSFNYASTSASFYTDRYLSIIATRKSETISPNPVDHALIEGTRRQTLSSQQTTRLKLLSILVRLRAHPALSWVARKIPMSAQRRIKSRLLGQK